MIPIVLVSQTDEPEEGDSEIIHPTTEEALHETVDASKEVDKAYIPPVQTSGEKGKEPEMPYSPWDASR